MEITEFIELYEEEGVRGIRGQMVLVDPSAKPDSNSILGIATEDVKKGDLVKVIL